MTKAGIYARVSKKDGKQDTENQLAQLRLYAKAQGWKVVEYIDRASGKSTVGREAFEAMFLAASRRQIQVVLVWSLDRLTREGVLGTFRYVQKLADYGCSFESYTEPYFRTTGAAGELLMAVLSWVAKQERLRISERTKAGLERARKQGRIGGRPHRVWDRQRACDLRAQGWSWRRLEKEMGIAHRSIRRAIEDMQPTVNPKKQTPSLAPKTPVAQRSPQKRPKNEASKGVKKHAKVLS